MAAGPRAARALMDRFAGLTGLETEGHDAAGRYLWTDAFAVCNWVGLGEPDRARSLVDRVHAVLGRHRPDDPREGWLSGLPDDEAARHPTRGGLRIGKPLPERGPDEPLDPPLEWDRDGQYFHYLTRWIQALERVSEATGEDAYHRWAMELARVAYDRFSHGIGPIPNRLYWKMSIGLDRPLVPSMGQHDALDGYVTLSRLAQQGPDAAGLHDAIDGLAGMIEGVDLATDDPLGAGALVTDAWFLARLPSARQPDRTGLLRRVTRAAALSLREIADARILELDPDRRLAFRELGLAIGLATLDGTAEGDIPPHARRDPGPTALRPEAARRLREGILETWTDPAVHTSAAWREHEAMNTVMLATALDPGGYLGGAL